MGMLGQAKEGLNASFKALIEGDSEPLDKAMTLVRQREERIDNLQNAATNYLHRISQENLTEEQSLRLPHLLHAVNDAERIGDHSVNIIKLARRSRKHELRFPEETLREMQEIYGTMATMLDEVVAAMEGEDSEKLAEIGNIEDRIDRLRKNLRKSHTDEQAAPGTDMRRNIVFLEFLTHVERVGDHLYNIAQATLKEVPTEEQV